MKLALYLIIILGATLLAFDLAKEVKNIEKEPAPEPTKPVRPQQVPDGHADVIKLTQQQLSKATAEIEKTPDLAAPYLKRAEILTTLDRYQEALNDLNKALSIEPQNADALFQRGYIHVIGGKTDQAIADFTSVLEIEPKRSKARLYRAIIQYRNNNFQPALDDCLQLLKLDPAFIDAHITASRCYMELNNKTKALEQLNIYIGKATDPAGITEAKRLIQLWNQEPDQEPTPAPTPAAPNPPSSNNE